MQLGPLSDASNQTFRKLIFTDIYFSPQTFDCIIILPRLMSSYSGQLIILLIALSAIVSSSELALASARKIKLQILAKEGDIRALEVMKSKARAVSSRWCKLH